MTSDQIMQKIWDALDWIPVTEHDEKPWKPVRSAIEKLVRERDAARAAVLADRAEREKDAERYRWLRAVANGQGEEDEYGCVKALEAMVEAHDKYQSPTDKGYAQREEGMRLALRAAIDKAMKEGK
jgi:hypothetical protein